MSDLVKRDTEYADMNAGAHRQAPPLTGTPALTWHRSFWRPSEETENLTPEQIAAAVDNPAKPGKWRKSVDTFLTQLFLILWEQSDQDGSKLICPNLDRTHLSLFRHQCEVPNKDNDGRYKEPVLDNYRRLIIRHDVFLCRITKKEVRLTFRATLSKEYWTFTIIADFPVLDSKDAQDVTTPVPSPAHSISEIAKLREAVIKINGYIVDRYGQSVGAKDPQDSLYEETIGKLSAICEDYISSGCKRLFGNSYTSLACCGTMFGEFFGLIVSVFPNRAFSDEAGRSRAQAVPTTKDKRIPDKITVNEFKDRGETLEMVHAVWPVLRRLHGGEGNTFRSIEETQGKPEFTVSLMQGGRALYMSALGRPASGSYTGADSPVTYIVVSTHAARWQIGRLLDRLHELGTVRLAAVRALGQIIRASDLLNNLSRDVADADVNAKELKARLVSLEMSVGMGLSFRLERSRNYIDRLYKLLGKLRPEGVIGFQTYQDLVETRLGDRFSLIETVSTGYERLKGDLSLRLNYEALRALQLQNAISIEKIEETNTLLDYAEFVIIAPLAYYVGDVLNKVFRIKTGLDTILGTPIDEGWFFVISIFLVLLLYYFRLQHRRAKRQKNKLGDQSKEERGLLASVNYAKN